MGFKTNKFNIKQNLPFSKAPALSSAAVHLCMMSNTINIQRTYMKIL